MLRNGKFTLIIIILLIISMVGNANVNGLDTGPINSSSYASSVPITINIKLWGFDSLFVPQLDLPDKVVQESINQKTDAVEQYRAYIFGLPFSWQYEIDYQYEIDPAPFSELEQFFNNQSVTIQTKAIINGSIQSIIGKGMEITKMSEFLGTYDSDKGYTIHVIDGSGLTGGSSEKYWYFSDLGNDYYQDMGDLRNLGAISPTSLFYDVNAFAPAFINSSIGSQRMIDAIDSSYTRNDFLDDRLTFIIEQIILGSPYSRDFSFVTFSSLPKIHFAKIVVGGDNSLTETYQIHSVTNENGFEQDLRSFFSFYPEKIEVTKDYTFFNDNARLQSFIEKNVVVINGTKSIIMDTAKAEELKNAIRLDRTIYSSFPSGFFLLSLFFNLKGDNYIQFLYNTSQGLRPYSADVIGLDIVDISEWLNLGGAERLSIELSDYALRSFGKLLGLPLLDDGNPAFLETPMSSYGLGKTKQGKSFTDIEMLGYFRKLMVWYNISSFLMYNSVLTKLENQKIGFIPHSELFAAEAQRINATVSWYKGNYQDAVQKFLIAFVNMSEAVRTVEQRISALANTLVWSAGVFFLFALHNLMMSHVKPPNNAIKRTKDGIPVSWYKKNQ